MKKFLILLLFALFFENHIILASEPAHILIINQVRGVECCSNGSFEFLKKQIKAHVDKKIPGYFSLRYDVLMNSEWMTFIKDSIKNNPKYIFPAIFLEITPGLATKAKVSHDITQDNWFEAQNAYTIGYSVDERIKLADVLFLEFFDQFGFYPKVVSAWMIDTPTLNYIHARYGVIIQQITREQYGTDSYTLYGGPPHYPYPASRNWLLIPDYENTDPVLIVRQTITDPLYNYGDKTSTFTSQPNDYMRGSKTFSYFTSLLTQTFAQPADQKGFALLGLENSMEEKYQREFEAQLELVGKLSSKKNLVFEDLDKIVNYWTKQKTTVYYGQDFINKTNNQAFWITTPKYRFRLIIKNDEMIMTDLRLYDNKFSDPYINYAALKNGYWIVPYLIDGSFNYKFDVKNSAFIGLFNNKKGKYIFEFDSDLKNKETDGLVLPKIFDLKSLKIERRDNEINISYLIDPQNKVTIYFYEDRINIAPIEKNELIFKQFNAENSPIRYEREADNNFSISWKNDKNLSANFKYAKNNWEVNFISNVKALNNLREIDYPHLFPEPVNRKINRLNSSLTPHNQYAVAGRNPVRLFFSAKDDYGLPVIVKSDIDIQTTRVVSKKEIVKNFANQYIQYVDLYADKPVSLKVSLTINKSITIPLKKKIYFAPNCKKELSYCLTHPIQTYWFIRSFLGDKFRK